MELDSPQVPARASARQAAQRYLQRGWSVIPVPHRSKNPGFKRWEQLRLTSDQLDQHFNGQPQNISVLLGEPSGWLIDVDLDHQRAVELAAQFLPPTALVFGRPAKPRSHWLYRVTAPLVTKKFSSRSSGMIVEVRSTGTHTVFPPSTHEIGEPIAWDDEQQEPAEVDPALLLESAQRLAEAVLIELGEKRPALEHQKRASAKPHTPASTLLA
ncbi:MAG: bifunctional DNA primase/polymerase, partial [Planctomycetaceae bacterium]|nr:bifunctional DNA primase/polymerase [Planctomycetaceae bacterium]